VTRKIYNIYKNFLDIQIKNSTIVVVIISMLIIFVWVYIPDNNQYSKVNVLEASKKDFLTWKTVFIDGIEYKLIIK